MFRLRWNKAGRNDIAEALAEVRRLHGGFIDELRANMEHLKRSANSSLKALEESSKQADELAETMKVRADQIGSLAADVDSFEARIAEVESQVADLRAAILINGLPPPGPG